MRSATFYRLLLAGVLSLLLSACRSTETPQPNSQSQTPSSSQSNIAGNEIRPKLAAKIENVSLYPVPNNNKDLAVSVVVTVTNSGVPGSAQDWTLALNSPTRSDLKSANPVHVNGVVDMPGSGTGQVDLSKEDLVLKSKQARLNNGDVLKGILTFVLPKTSASELSSNGSTLALNFKDDRGGSYQTPSVKIGLKINR